MAYFYLFGVNSVTGMCLGMLLMMMCFFLETQVNHFKKNTDG